jgi:Zn-dependent protease with chaperone function
MQCPQCGSPTLRERLTPRHARIDVCSECEGLWLDRGKIYEFTAQPQALEAQLLQGARDPQPTEHRCPRCEAALTRATLADRDAQFEQCPHCGGLWFQADELQRAVQAGDGDGAIDFDEPEPEADPQAREAARQRLRDMAAGVLALPNLFLRSALTLALLYGLVVLVLISLVEFRRLDSTLAVVIGVAFALFQFTFGPWIMDFMLRYAYRFSWVRPEELPEHLRTFVARVCQGEKMRFPSFGIIHDGAPQAFTYGHHPSNARVVISEGILSLLEPDEVEAVVAHELGHCRNWDMVLMTLANLVPLLLYWLYRLGTTRGRDKAYGWAISVGAYVVYIVSEYIVLWFSRTREYFADRFAGQATGNPNALASALVKIAYGLVTQDAAEHVADAEKEAAAGKDKKKKEAIEKERQQRRDRVVALRALNIFDPKAATALVMASGVDRGTDARRPNTEHLKSAMQWDLWNPWAKFYELHSTHPLVANRLLHLADQAAHQGQEPLVVFDRRKPESYWDEFFVDLFMMTLPWLAFLLGVGAAVATWNFALFGVAVALGGIFSIVKTNFVYRRGFFPYLSVAALLHKVKVSAVRPVPATLEGTIIGKGVPGLIWSEDFVLQDRTGILFMDYRQPLAIWDFLFGLLRAGQYQGKRVRVRGWFRRAPVPFLEVYEIESVDGDLPRRRCYSLHARLAVGGLLAVLGLAAAVALLVL